jgi:Gas vesicle protein G
MGLFTALATLPLAPVRGVAWVAEQVAEEADRKLYDERSIRREMLQLELDHDDGKIDQIERQRREEELLERLAVSQARRAAEQEEMRAWEEMPASEEEEMRLAGEEVEGNG